MLRKLGGILLLVLAVLIVVGAAANGTFTETFDTSAEKTGKIVGTLLPVVVNVFAVIFLLGFDKVYQRNYADGFRVRNKQCGTITFYLIVYIAFMMLVSFSAATSGADDFWQAFLLAELPYIIPMAIFAMMLGYYMVPYKSCKSNVGLEQADVNAYLSTNEAFYTYTADQSVIASSRALFFPKIFCLIPFDRIASVKFINIGVEQDISFQLTTGKKAVIVSNKKQYEGVMAALKANK